MIIKKNYLKDVEVNVDDKEIINLLNEWCMNDYHTFGGILNIVTKIGKRIILLKDKQDNNSFLTFDKNANPLNIQLIIDKENDNQRRLIIDKYGDIHEYLYSQIDNNICITEVIMKNNKENKKNTRRI